MSKKMLDTINACGALLVGGAMIAGLSLGPLTARADESAGWDVEIDPESVVVHASDCPSLDYLKPKVSWIYPATEGWKIELGYDEGSGFQLLRDEDWDIQAIPAGEQSITWSGVADPLYPPPYQQIKATSGTGGEMPYGDGSYTLTAYVYEYIPEGSGTPTEYWALRDVSHVTIGEGHIGPANTSVELSNMNMLHESSGQRERDFISGDATFTRVDPEARYEIFLNNDLIYSYEDDFEFAPDCVKEVEISTFTGVNLADGEPHDYAHANEYTVTVYVYVRYPGAGGSWTVVDEEIWQSEYHGPA